MNKRVSLIQPLLILALLFPMLVTGPASVGRAASPLMQSSGSGRLLPSLPALDSDCSDGRCVFAVSASADDAGPKPECGFDIDWPEIYFGRCFGGAYITSGFRFPNVTLDRDSQIRRAYLVFTVDGDYTNPVTVNLYGEDSTDAQPFSDSSQPEERPRLGGAVTTWRINDEWGPGQAWQTPDIAPIVEAIVGKPDWQNGNALVIIAETANTNLQLGEHRRVYAFDREGTSFSARLVVELAGFEPPDAVSPTGWTMALSLRPTFTWKKADTADSYRLTVYRAAVDDIEELVIRGSQLKVFNLPADLQEIPCPADADQICVSFKPGAPYTSPPEPYSFELSSGTTIETGGYFWEVEALDGNGAVIKTGREGFFQIPPLGRFDQETCVALLKGTLLPADLARDCDPGSSYFAVHASYWNQYDDLIYRWSEARDLPPALVKAIFVHETGTKLGPLYYRTRRGRIVSSTPPARAYLYEPKQDYDNRSLCPDNVCGDPLLEPFKAGTLPPFDSDGRQLYPKNIEIVNGIHWQDRPTIADVAADTVASRIEWRWKAEMAGAGRG